MCIVYLLHTCNLCTVYSNYVASSYNLIAETILLQLLESLLSIYHFHSHQIPISGCELK